VRRGASSVAANPVLIGAATILIVIVAVFLAYNANAGLPFVPTYDLRSEVPNAANLVVGNDVRIGGTRVGAVTDIDAVRRADGRITAELTLQLEEAVQPLPDDSTVLIRSRSALGLKYVEISRGTSRAGFENGATIPLRQATPEPVEIDQVLNTFDEPTRAGSRTNLNEFGGALAGRGQSLNEALGSLPLLLTRLEPVMRGLSRQETGLRGFVRGLGAAAAEVAPVGEQQAQLFVGLDRTFGAFADVAPQLQESIETAPPLLDTGIRELPAQRPFLRNTQALFRELRPGVRALRGAAPELAGAFTVGQTTLRRSVALNRRLESTFREIQAFSEDPMTSLGVNGLRNLSEILRPTLADVTPAQTVCNYASMLLRNGASLLSEGDSRGTWQRFIIISAPLGENNEGGPSSAPANGPSGNFLHANPYPNTPGRGRTNECEAGREPFTPAAAAIGNVAGNQGRETDDTRVEGAR
jgi:virulence factor Mce-like protein